MSEKILPIRRAIVRLNVGDSTELPINNMPISEAATEAKHFAKIKKLSIDVKTTATGLILTRSADPLQISMYPELDALEVGQSHLFQVPAPFHQRIRVAASSRNRSGTVRLACTREGDFIRVTRLPMTAEEQATAGPITAPARQTKYGLERLSSQRHIVFDTPREDRAKLRLAVSNYAARQGWTIRCRLQDDGTMLVYRTDAGAPKATAASSTAQ